MKPYDLWNRSAAVFAAALGLTLLPWSGAAHAQAPTGPDTTSSTTEDSTGKVTAVSNDTISVTSRRGPFTYRLGQDLHVIGADNQRLKISDVHAGQEATVYYYLRDGEPTVARIVLLKPAGKDKGR